MNEIYILGTVDPVDEFPDLLIDWSKYLFIDELSYYEDDEVFLDE